MLARQPGRPRRGRAVQDFRTIIFPLLWAMFLGGCAGGDSGATPLPTESRSVVITGVVSVKGSSPQAVLVITTRESGSYEIIGEITRDLAKNYQGAVVTLEGRVIREPAHPRLGCFMAKGIRSEEPF
ncbi:hypothetical protein SAMN05920897_108126 [Alkalispirochaeta americana]|uniref:Uncharacterized protein n=1 Tax=Alkalispirochaeta americana TaxID=159291 RepID=A0A1N6SKP8_9SPIO|nr:hypothetical protein [Alkalispirochaeta americana]SIQ41713.1 hypothetical protein SAMN05920897_108126 [Alkalispirochaeta americana]